MALPNESSPEASARTAAYKPICDELFMLILSERNKAEIFEHGLIKLNRNQDEASKILETLDQWDPYTRSLFASRSSSTILSTPFRLVYPMSHKSSFYEDGFEDGFYVRQYMAVSYCWRSNDFLPENYERHGSWPISKPFVDAIIKEKNHHRVGIWMDQLCIDQLSSEDKRQSVAAMDVIYRSCLRLLVLLEDVFLDQAEVALVPKYDPLKVKHDSAWRPPAHEQSLLTSFYRKVTAARWWARAWCFHEFNVNEPWTDKRQCNEIHNATFIMNGPNGSTVRIKWWTLHNILTWTSYEEEQVQAIFMPIDHGDRESGYRSSIMARHNTVITKGCMLLEDRLNIMVNISGLALAYKGQTQRTADEVLYVSSVLALAAGEAYPLTMFDGRILPTLQDRPTWFQRHLLSDITIPRFKKGGLSGIHHVSMQDIKLDMIFLPPLATWTDFKDDDLQPTHKIFPHTIATTRIDSIYTRGPVSDARRNASQPDEDLDRPRRRFLAGCLLNGYAFTARLWAQLKTDVVGPNYNQGFMKDLAPKPSLLPAAEELIRQLFPVPSLPSTPTSPTFTCEDAHLFLTWLTDPRSMYYIGSCTHQFQCSVGLGAFITNAQVNAHYFAGPFEDLRAAVPIDLLEVSCIPLRVWLLRPCYDERATSQWRLVGKALLLGETDLRMEASQRNGGGDAAVELKTVVIGG